MELFIGMQNRPNGGKIKIKKSPAVARLADRTGCQWPSKFCKIDDFNFIWKGACHFLL